MRQEEEEGGEDGEDGEGCGWQATGETF